MHTHVREHTHIHILIRTLYTHIPSLSFFFSHSPIHFLPMNHNNGYSRFGRNSSMRKRLARASERTNAIKWYQTDNINLANSFAFLTTGDCPWSENILFSFFFFFFEIARMLFFYYRALSCRMRRRWWCCCTSFAFLFPSWDVYRAGTRVNKREITQLKQSRDNGREEGEKLGVFAKCTIGKA